MKNKNINFARYAEYFFSAIYYCLWLYIIRRYEIVKKIEIKLFHILITVLFPKDSREYHYNSIIKNISNRTVNYKNKKDGLCIYMTYRLFYAICYCYAVVFFVLYITLYTKYTNELINVIPFVIILLLSIILADRIAYLLILSGDKYIQYFDRFEQEDEQWHKKWKRRTIIFSFGVIAMLALDFYLLLIIFGGSRAMPQIK